ncbi:hypothetical protein ES708_06192 [subsurface metagenome]
MSFLNSLNDRLTTMEREVQALPGELDSVVRRLDRGKLQSVLIRLEQDCDQLYEKQSAARSSGGITLPWILSLQPLSITPITSEDRSRWREAYKSEVRVVIGEGKVEVMAASRVAGKYKTTVSQIAPVAQQKGYTVLSWEQYIDLLDEIGTLIGE